MTGAAIFAAALQGYRRRTSDGPAARLLAQLDYSGADDGETRGFRDGALKLAAAADDVFLLNRPAPGGVRLLGMRFRSARFGLADAADEVIFAGGRGLGMRDAFESCVGEAFERLCLQGRGTAASGVVRDAPSGVRRLSGIAEGDAGGWVMGRSLGGASAVAAPVDHVYRRASGQRRGVVPPSSAGCGAGASLAEAVRSGLSELIERDAVALWWLGGAPGAAPPAAAENVLRGLYPRQSQRVSWLLDLTTDLGVPVIAALSSDRQGGEVIVGAGSGRDAAEAACRAVTELVQMEQAAEISRAKAKTGVKLGAGDHIWLQRLQRLNTRDFPILLPRARRGEPRFEGDMVAAVLRADTDVSAFDISIDGFGMSAARLIAPMLQTCAADIVTDRLRKVLSATNHDFDKHRTAPQPL